LTEGIAVVRTIVVLPLCAAALIASSCGGDSADEGPPPASFLFSIPAASGSLRGPSDDALTLRLAGTRNYLTQFSDRPLREAFVIANVDFVRLFPRYFPGSEPNAVLTYTPQDARIPISVVLTIGAPHWNASRSTWTIPARRIRKQADNLPGSTVQIAPPAIPNPRSLHDATLVIDDSIDNGVQGG
jgi:hypothetical protein